MKTKPAHYSTSTKIYYARTIGSFFLLAFIAYGLGRHFFESANAVIKNIGGLFIIMNSLIVLAIGKLLKKTLQHYSVWVGNSYYATRIIEAVAFAIVVLNVIPIIHIPVEYGYFLAMFVLGIGSVPMCYTLFIHKISPPWIALWGAIAYAVFAIGFFMELLGKQSSIYFLAPAAVWEITFAIWLISKDGKKDVN
jgi:hypothetical protein